MHQGDMGNQASTPMPLLDASPVRLPDAGATGSTDDKSRIITTASEPTDFLSEEVFSQQPEVPMEMKRLLLPPKSREVVREEGKRARDIINLCVMMLRMPGRTQRKLRIRRVWMGHSRLRNLPVVFSAYPEPQYFCQEPT